MPKLEEAIYSYLTNDPQVSALVDDRVYAVRGPEKAVIPYISWVRVSANRIYTFDPFETTDAWTTARIQFNCWATTAMAAMDVGEAVLAALSGYEGDIGGELIGASFAVNELDTYEPEPQIFRRILDFFISYEDDVVGTS